MVPLIKASVFPITSPSRGEVIVMVMGLRVVKALSADETEAPPLFLEVILKRSEGKRDRSRTDDDSVGLTVD